MKNKRAALFLAAGALCLVGAASLAGYNLWDDQRAGDSAQKAAAVLALEIPAEPETTQPMAPEPKPMMTTVEIDGRYHIGLLELPAREPALPVQNTWSETLLKYSPCLYEGNLADGMIIAGHNYRTHFAKLNTLPVGETVRFTDVDGNRWNYTIAATEIIPGYDVEAMTSGDWDLTLFTCTYGGQERYTVRCTLDTELRTAA